MSNHTTSQAPGTVSRKHGMSESPLSVHTEELTYFSLTLSTRVIFARAAHDTHQHPFLPSQELSFPNSSTALDPQLHEVMEDAITPSIRTF